LSFVSIVIFIMWTFSANKHMDGWMDGLCENRDRTQDNYLLNTQLMHHNSKTQSQHKTN